MDQIKVRSKRDPVRSFGYRSTASQHIPAISSLLTARSQFAAQHLQMEN
jgi:hypothetical protein